MIPPANGGQERAPSEIRRRRGRGPTARVHLLVSFLAGLVVGVPTSLADWRYGVLLGWIVATGTFIAWMWATVWPMNAEATAEHAVRVDPGREYIDVIVIVAAVASLGAVALLLITGASGAESKITAALCFASVALAWATVHTTFTARYARLYYTGPDGGVDFNQKEPPRYTDFAYLAFTLGMTYQVSDTDLTSEEIRRTALQHALLSFLFGAVFLAAIINLLAGIAA